MLPPSASVKYQDVIDNFPKLSQNLRAQLNNLSDEPRQVSTISSDALNQEILQVSSQLLEASRKSSAGAGSRPRYRRFA